MPTTVLALFEDAGLGCRGPIPWLEEVPSSSPGVYVVSSSDDPAVHNGLSDAAPVSSGHVAQWLAHVPSIELDGRKFPSAAELAQRLSEFWIADESILYIGMSNRPVRKRVQEYYSTPLGDRRPHAGGHWIKTLSNLPRLFLYHAPCTAPDTKEGELIGFFVQNVSVRAKRRLRDPEHPFPFANLEFPKGTRKKHGIGKAKR